MTELKKKITTETLIENVPPEKRWAITAKALTRFYTLIALKTGESVLGKEEGIFAPISGWEMRRDINEKVLAEGARRLYQWAKETFNISVEDAIGADNLCTVVGRLQAGPEFEGEYIEKTPERVVYRITKCPWMERYKELEADPAFIPCPVNHPVVTKEGLKAIGFKISFTLTKAMPWGDPYCEEVFVFKEE